MKDPVFIAAEFPKGNGEIVRIALDEYKGRPTLDIRVWYQPAHGEPRPSSKGLTARGVAPRPASSAASTPRMPRP